MTPDETTAARLLLFAAISLLRDQPIDSYVIARLERYGYTPDQVAEIARQLAADAERHSERIAA